MSLKAEELKTQGNACFQAGDFAGAEKFYTQAIIKDSTNAAFFTNRALTRLRMEMYEEVICDCLKAIELLPTSLKAYTYLGQAQLQLNHPGEALSSSLQAYELAISQRSPSVSQIAGTCLEAKKKRWEQTEKRRIENENTLLRETIEMMKRDRCANIEELRRGQGGGPSFQEEIEAIEQEFNERKESLEEVFAKADSERCRRREVPDYLIDNISFSIMLDPVVTKHGHSYDRSTLMDHLRRSQTDPLTREPLTEHDLRPNLALRAACDSFLKENGWAVDW
ncbi:hypothetical protein RUND412_003504 [Rhizina undulata]